DRYRSRLSKLAHHLYAVQVWQHHVEQGDVWSQLIGYLDGLRSAVGGDHPELLLPQGGSHQLRDPRLVVCDENERLSVHARVSGDWAMCGLGSKRYASKVSRPRSAAGTGVASN